MGGTLTRNHLNMLRRIDNPVHQYTVLWKEGSNDLERMIFELSSFSWVLVMLTGKLLLDLKPGELALPL